MARTRLSFGGAVFVAAVLLASCGGSGGGEASPTTTVASAAPSTGAVSSTSTTVTGSEGEQSGVELDLPREITYAGAHIEISDANRAAVRPSTYGSSTPSPADETYLFLTLNVAYGQGYPGRDALFPARNFHLVLADGTTIEADGVEHMNGVPIEAASETTSTLAFADPGGNLEGVSFGYDDGEHVPALVPLVGPVDTSPFPIHDDVDESATVDFASGCEPVPAQVTLEAVEWDVDGGEGADGQRLVQGDSSRATAGQRFLRADFHITAGTGRCGGTFPNADAFRVKVDGAFLGALNIDDHFDLDDGESLDVIYLFSVPATADKAQVVAGFVDAQTHAFEVPVPADLAAGGS